MAARGPDGAGVWWSNDGRVGLGHRRLSIIDLADRSNQPMLSSDGRRVIVFNGEIYNLPELRRELEAAGCVFRTTSDTEALLHLHARMGAAMTDRLRGMFAFAIWDNKERSLFLARDPFGIKPLYYADDGSTFRFASQVKALLFGGAITTSTDPAGVVGFHLWGSVPEPFTLHTAIRALPAGSSLTVKMGRATDGPRSFISLAGEMAHGAAQTIPKSDLDTCVREAARDSVAAHLLADVDVGLFLSAGIDSCALLGLMADSRAQRIHAITLGFDSFIGTPDDEVPLAAAVAQLYGARHTVRRIGQAEFEQDLPAILEAMDQPSIDGVNTWFVAKAAREAGLKVALSGLGGDEMLAGYPGFVDIPRMANTLAPFRALPFLGTAARYIIDATGASRNRPKMAGLLELGGSLPGAYLLRRGLFLPSELPRLLGQELAAEGLTRLDAIGLLSASLKPDPGSDVGCVAALECGAYTRNQLLRDADWAGMAHSIEIRTPLLDIGFLRAVAPVMAAIRGRSGKQALGAAPLRALPTAVTSRAKSGFAVPTGRWMANAADTSLANLGVAPAINKGLASRAWAQFVYSATSASRSGST
jgi:asparagine synthase (glutamine-hydrolysing)